MSVTSDLGSDLNGASGDLEGGAETSVAHELVSWSTSWVDSWINASIGVTATSSDSVLKSGTLVVHLQVSADTRWIAGVESSSSNHSIELGSEGH